MLRDIGRGTCGSVFEVPGTTLAIKKGSVAKSMWNDFNLTNKAQNSYINVLGLFASSFAGRTLPRIPLARFYNGPAATEWWKTNISRFPRSDQSRAAIFHIDRILPVVRQTREALVRQFFVRDAYPEVMNNGENKDCLIRLYFGQLYPRSAPYSSDQTLRNFPLYLDQAKSLGLDVDGYTEEMAMGLATIHWGAEIDGADVEFVIGSSTSPVYGKVVPNHASVQPPTSTMDDFTHRETQLWMLDFDKCSKGDLKTPAVVQQYFVAVTGNDPYFPHPRLDFKLWQTFRNAYLKASSIIITTRGLEQQAYAFPEMLMDRWEQWGEEDADADAFDPFERTCGGSDEEDTEGEDGEDDDEEDTEDEDGDEEDEDDTDEDEEVVDVDSGSEK
jgi:hypothetical protein